MSSKIPFPSLAGVGWLRFWLPLLALLLCGSALARQQDIVFGLAGNCVGQSPNPITYAADTNNNNPVNDDITVVSACIPSTFSWTTPGTFDICAGNASMTYTVPAGQNNKVTIAIQAKPPQQLVPCTFALQAKLTCQGAQILCPYNYSFRALSGGTGFGDPHMTTVDGVAYDFQGAGEFTTLRGKRLEIQTRQTAVPTAPAFPPIPANAYTGLSTCVSIYTAVAARVGKHRVSYQPNISGDPDPSGMQLWVDHVLTKLGPEGIDLASEGPSDEDEDEDERATRGKYQPRQHGTAPTQGAIVKHPSAGRIVQSPAGGGIEIHYADGTKLVVTPAFWPSQQKWYLNVTVSETTATKGIMGLTKDAWLPALPDGASLGPKPPVAHDRYVQVYEKFADAWRVTDYTSLFHYKKGTDTQTFTNRDWPGENPSACTIKGAPPPAQPLDVTVAEKLCSAVVDENNKANCIFDVRATGNPGFAETYKISERLQPGLTETTVKDDTDPTKIGDSVTFTATVLPALARGGGVPAGNVQFIVDGNKAGDPVALDTIGRATWSTSNLKAGEHHVVAKYNPTGFGEQFLASSSPKICHTVEEGGSESPN